MRSRRHGGVRCYRKNYKIYVKFQRVIIISSSDHSAGVIRHNEKGLDVVVLEVRVALLAVARLHLVLVAEAIERVSRDVHAAATHTHHIQSQNLIMTF